MATSSTPGDQLVGCSQSHVKVQCDICDTEKDAKSHCTECVRNMCVNCKQFHDKFHIDHKFLTVFEARIVKHLNIRCQTHDSLFLYYCENCQINVCNKCRKTTHKICNLIDIDEHAKILKTSLTKEIDEYKKHLPEIDKMSNRIKDHLPQFDKTIESEINLVETETKKKKHKNLDDQRSDLIKQLKSKQTSVHEADQIKIQILQDLKRSIDDITKSTEIQKNLVRNAGVLHLVNESKSELDSTSIETLLSSISEQSTMGDNQFLHSSWNAGNFDTHIEPKSTLDGTKSPSPAHNANHSTPVDQSPLLRQEISIAREFPLGSSVCSSICPDGSACWVGWYSGWFSVAVQLLNHNGDQVKVHLSHYAEYMALTATGELLVSGNGTTVISLVNKLGKVCKFADITAPDVKSVRGLVTTRQGDVFVCVVMTGNKKDKVIRFSEKGNKISEVNSHFFTSSKLYGIYPVSRDIFCILDGEGTGSRLVFVDGLGQLIRYLDRTTKELSMKITALAGDRHGHLIIGTSGGYIYVLSSKGECKRKYCIPGSRAISGVSVSEYDYLWIGTVIGSWLTKLLGLDKGKLIVAKYLCPMTNV